MQRHKHLTIALEKHVESLMESLDLPVTEYSISNRDIRGCAPCHDGDNPTAWIYYFDKGKWFCWTEGCHNEYGSDLLGLIRAVKQITFKEAIKYASDFMKTKKNPSKDEILSAQVRSKKNRNYWDEHLSQKTYHDSLLRRLDPPISYAKLRGFSVSVLRQMGAGYAKSGKMGGRIVLPIKNIKGEIVGFTGRKIYDNMDGPKWLHEVKSEINFFNIDRALKNMIDIGCQSILITEGPWDAIKLEMSGYPNVVACLGAHISNGQIEILKKSDVSHVVLMLDNNKAGLNGINRAIKRLEKEMFEISIILPPDDRDWGDKNMSADEIKEIIERSEVNLPNERIIK